MDKTQIFRVYEKNVSEGFEGPWTPTNPLQILEQISSIVNEMVEDKEKVNKAMVVRLSDFEMCQ